jgi:cell division septum initiation protein DivIVA
MKKLHNLLSRLKFLPVVAIFHIWLLCANKLVYAETFSPTSSPITNQAKSQTSSLNDFFAAASAIGSLLSGLVAVAAYRKSVFSQGQTDALLISATKALDDLIKGAKDEDEKKRLQEAQRAFENQLRNLIDRSTASKNAKKWLKDKISQLTHHAVDYVLQTESVNQKTIDKFSEQIEKYLKTIQECLDPDIGRTNLLDEVWVSGMKT